jgi:hypothetical protein
MPDLSSLIPETHQNLSFGYVEVLLQEHRQELFSGLMRISYPSGENFVFIFLEGVQKNLYRCFQATTEVVNRQTWSDVLNRPEASVGFLPLGVDGLRIIRVVLEAPVQSMEQAALTSSELVDCLRLWAKNPEPAFVYLRSENMEHIHVLVGNPNPVIEGLSVAIGQATFSLGDASFGQTIPAADYKVTRYLSKGEYDTWREYKLRLAFQPLMRILIARFGELAGRVLAERLGAQLTDWVTSGGWNMNINGNGVVNREFFDSLEEALEVYVGLLRRFRDEAGLAVGLRLVENMFRETLMRLPPVFRDILNQYMFELFGPGGAALIVQKEIKQL